MTATSSTTTSSGCAPTSASTASSCKKGSRSIRSTPRRAASSSTSSTTSASFDATAVERDITAPDSNRRILQELKRYTDAHEAEHGRFPKTLIFAANDLPHTSHSDQLVDQARDIFGQGDAFVAKITGRVDRPLQRIREFRNRAKPGIVVTVDLLTTGVDIPDLEFLVFLRPVKSRILFEQMLGRGTRLGEKATDKDHFVVFDCFDGTLIEYFAGSTGITAEPAEGDGKSLAQIIEEIWQNKDRAYNTKRLVRRLRRIDKNMSGDARDLFARFVEDGDLGKFAEDLPSLLHKMFSPTMQTLRDGDFQRLLDDYPRAPRSFIIAEQVTDQVSSEWLIKGADGTQYKPTDYLKAFGAFVRSEAETIDALSVLLSPPQRLEPRSACRSPRRAQDGARALHPGEPGARPPRRLPEGSGRHHLDGQARRARHRTATDRRGARRGRHAAHHRRARTDGPSRQHGWTASSYTSCRTSRSTARTSRSCRSSPTTAGGYPPTRASTASSPSCSQP